MAVTIEDIESIKEKIADAKTKSAKAEGAKERLINQLNEDFDITEEDIDTKIEEYDSLIDKDTKRIEKLLTKLDEIANWDDI